MALVLRDYQEEAIAAVKAAWAQNQKALVLLPTGSGKSFMAGTLLIEAIGTDKRCLFLAHRDELISQPEAMFKRDFPAYANAVGVVKAERNEITQRIIIGSVQTLQNENRLDALLAAGPIDYFLIDECHHITLDGMYNVIWMRILEQNPQAKLLGVTATGMRPDGLGLGDIFDGITYQLTLVDLIRRGDLCPLTWLAVQTGVSLAGVKLTRNADGVLDFNQGQLDDVLNTANAREVTFAAWLKHTGGKRPSIGFTTSVGAAYAYAAYWREMGYPAAALDATTPATETRKGKRDGRKEILEDLRSGALICVFNYRILTEGFDLPILSCILIIRPTNSIIDYAQMIGRGTRPDPTKTNCILMEMTSRQSRMLGFVSSILGIPRNMVMQPDAAIDAAEAGAVVGALRVGRSGQASRLVGDVDHIVAEEMDYLNQSAYSFDLGQSGWTFTTVAVSQSKTAVGSTASAASMLAISPYSYDSPHYRVVLIDERKRLNYYGYINTDYDCRTVFDADDYADIKRYCNSYLEKYGDKTFTAKEPDWARKNATAEQLAKLQRAAGKDAYLILIGQKDKLSRGEAARLIKTYTGEKALKKTGYWEPEKKRKVKGDAILI